MAKPGATPSHQFFAGFNAFFSSTWQKTRVEQVSLKVFHLWRILGHPTVSSIRSKVCLDATASKRGQRLCLFHSFEHFQHLSPNLYVMVK